MSSGVKTNPTNIVRGILLIIAAAFTISIQDIVFKLFSSELTLWQIFTLRGLIAVPTLLAASWMRRTHLEIVRAALGKWTILRSIFITTTFLAFYSAIPFLSLSTVGAANYIAPIFVAMLSAYVIKETVGFFGWLGVLLGFIGVVVLLQPGTDAFSPWALLPVIGAFFYALGHITTRIKCQNVPLTAITLSLNLTMLLAGVGVSLFLFYFQPQGQIVENYPYIFGMWSEMGITDWLVIVLLAGFSISIGMMLAGAYQVAPPTIVSIFEYSYLIFVAVWDILFFGIAPSFTSVTGMILIVVAGLLVLQRKSKNH